MQTKYVRSVNSMTAGTLPQGMENHSAYNIFDLFNAAAPSARTAGGSFFDPFGFFGSLSSEEDGGRMSIPLEKCSLFGVSLHPIPEKEASLSGTECSVFMGNN